MLSGGVGYIYIYIYIYILIIKSCRKHGYPWHSLATSPYRSSPTAGLQGYIPYPHIAAVCMFELVVLFLLGHMWGVHRSTSLMSLSLLLQQCPACLFRLTIYIYIYVQIYLFIYLTLFISLYLYIYINQLNPTSFFLPIYQHADYSKSNIENEILWST